MIVGAKELRVNINMVRNVNFSTRFKFAETHNISKSFVNNTDSEKSNRTVWAVQIWLKSWPFRPEIS